MSSDMRRSHAEAFPIAESLVDLLRPHCEEIMIAGSLRRQKPDVGDIEIVIRPRPSYHSFTDALVARGVVEKALYGEKRPAPRWGMDYRGMIYQKIKCEVFCYDGENRGYQQWLRTGPGDANKVVMSQLIRQRSPVRLLGSYAWHATQWTYDAKKKEWVGEDRRKLVVASEEDLFALLGMPFIPPEKRSVRAYEYVLTHKKHQWGDWRQFVAKQSTLFNLDGYFEAEWRAAVKRGTDVETSRRVPFRWRKPWLLADGTVLIRQTGAGKSWYERRHPDDPQAVQYRQTVLDGETDAGGMFVTVEALALRDWLVKQWQAARAEIVADVLEEAMSILEAERV